MEMQQFQYDNKIVRNFIYASIVFGVVGMLVGLILAFMFLFPNVTSGISFLSFGRLRPLHTNAVIFAFVGNAMFAGVYYSMQRLLKARMFSDFLSKLHFWGWQLIIVAAAVTLPLGYTTSKEYAELEWPIDIAIALILGSVWDQHDRNHNQKKRASYLCSHLVLHCYFCYGSSTSYFQQFRIAGFFLRYEIIFRLRRCTRCFGTMVVRTQCGGFLLDYAILRDDVLLCS